MSRGLLYSRFKLLSVGFLILLTLTISSSSTLNSKAETLSKSDVFSDEIELENALFNFTVSPEEITRGEDDLILYFTFTYENLTYIPDATVYYNISDPLNALVIENTLIVNTSETFNIYVSYFRVNRKVRWCSGQA